MNLPEILVGAALLYLAFGLAFSIPFAFVGAGRIDPDARGATLGFRLLVIPGATLLWPLLARRWVVGAGPPEECTPHRRATAGGDG